MQNIQSITPTICNLMQVPTPALCGAEALPEVLSLAKTRRISRIDKCLLYAPDAIGGVWLFEKYRQMFAEVEKRCDLRIEMRSVFPPKTPVCFASMFTGAAPEVHGVQWPDRPVLKCDTVFDAMLRAGKRVAIAAVEGSSIEKMYRGRDIEYRAGVYDQEVNDIAAELIDEGEYDLVVAYNQEYDDLLHKTGPESADAKKALSKHCETFARLYEAARRAWQGQNWMASFSPDHGGHFDEVLKKGVHGDNIPEDMHIVHFFAFSGVV